MRTKILLITAILLSLTGVIQALDTPIGEVAVDVDATWVSKYIWRGWDILDDKAAFQPSVNFDFGNGVSFNVWSSFAGASKHGAASSTVDLEEWDYTLSYANSAFQGQSYATEYSVSWIYYDYPDTTTWDTDAQEINVALAWPEISSFGVVPSYTVVAFWGAKGGHGVRDISGFYHIFGLAYDLDMAEIGKTLSFTWDITFNDGQGVGVDHDWSHIVWGLSTSFDIGQGSLTPAIYYQTSMEDSVNESDEFWVGISYGFSF